RLESVGRLADDGQLEPLLQQVAENPAHRGVIVDDQNLERVRGRNARGAGSRRPDHGLALRIQCAAGVLSAERRDQTEPRPMTRAALDVEPAAEQSQTLADAEEAPSGGTALR